MNEFEYGRDMPWSDVEKNVAPRAFELAYERECTTVAAEVRKRIAQNSNPTVIWEIHDYLSEQRRMADTKYDYRCSLLINIFGRLVAERWLSLDALAGLSDEKIERMERSATFGHNYYPSSGGEPDGPRQDCPRARVLENYFG